MTSPGDNDNDVDLFEWYDHQDVDRAVQREVMDDSQNRGIVDDGQNIGIVEIVKIELMQEGFHSMDSSVSDISSFDQDDRRQEEVCGQDFSQAVILETESVEDDFG